MKILKLDIIESDKNILTGTKKEFRSGYASLIGRPNVGKSTLMNSLVEQKIAAMSRRPQTTRNKITGICHLPGGQIILLDTPGIHKAATKLDQAMVKTSMRTYGDVDLILFMIDARKGYCEDDEYVLNSMQKVTVPKFLVINKVDLMAKPDLLGLIAEMSKSGNFDEIIPISALQKDGLDALKSSILSRFDEGPEYFPKDMVTDCPEEFLTGEIIREKIIKLTHLEIPYTVAVVVESMQQSDNGTAMIDATIYTEKNSQKKILIGEKGSLLKKVGTQARQEIEKRLGSKVFLKLFVKVKANWRGDENKLKEFGYSRGTY
ncbi:MAG: GTPase Era [Nitrospinales bacterium]